MAGLTSSASSGTGSAISFGAGRGAAAGGAAAGTFVGAAIPIAGSIYSSSQQMDANNKALEDRGNNIPRYHNQIRENSKNYLNGVKLDDGATVEKGVFQINEEYAGKMEGATREYTQRAADAINRPIATILTEMGHVDLLPARNFQRSLI